MAGWALPVATGAANFLGGLVGGADKDKDRSLMDRQVQLQEQNFAERQPLRAMGLARLQQPRPERPNLSADFADPSNPFATTPQAIGFGKRYEERPDINLDSALADYQAMAMGPWGKYEKKQQEKEAARGNRPNVIRTIAEEQNAGKDVGALETIRRMGGLDVFFGR